MRISDWSSDVCSSDLAVDDQLADILDGDVAGDVGVVEATVRVFLDDARLGHGAKALTDASLQHGAVQHGLQEAGTGGWGLASTRASRRREMRAEEHTSELQALMRISYAVFCCKKK